MERETLYVRIIDDIVGIVPVCKAVLQRRQKSDERYDCDDAATGEYAAKVLPGRLLFVAIQVLCHK